MKTYLVTGGAGFIGSNYIHYMMKRYNGDIRIINLDKLTYAGNLENLKDYQDADNYRFIRADIYDRAAVADIFSKYDIDYIIHFAAESHVDRSIEDPGIFARTNVLGTLSLLDAARAKWEKGDGFAAGKKFVQVSTDEVYGSLGETGYFHEETPLDPHSPYSASKASADMFVKAYVDTYGMPCCITRCSNNYGPYQFPEKLIPLIINNVLEGKTLPVYGDGKNVRDWLYVQDHAKAIDLVTQGGTPGSVYNVGGHNEKQNIEIVELIIDTVAQALPQGDPRKRHATRGLIRFVEDRKGHDRRYAINPEKIKRELGWTPEVIFSQGIQKTIRWYLENREWINNVTSGSYQTYYEAMYTGRKVL